MGVENGVSTMAIKNDIKKPPHVFQAEINPPKSWIGSRHVVTFMLFLGMANAYVMRTNMSVAIVAMVNHTASNDAAHDEIVVNECPETPYDSMENNPDVRELYTRVK
ncbi:hypothetical protein PV328_004387 [Microctonus aethiopoides]|uniref:Inorganic phosphate cotransporter n=1 Tax=Microctonus aethiopoides TaxID=144406 RepID=A0AA39KLP1_9HYME|nr:hypothetical protein PV328_004387 [Microctonus aethiopoides]